MDTILREFGEKCKNWAHFCYEEWISLARNGELGKGKGRHLLWIPKALVGGPHRSFRCSDF